MHYPPTGKPTHMKAPPLPPMQPMRICLNLDEIPLTQTLYEQPPAAEDTNRECMENDAKLLNCFMLSRFPAKSMIQSNFASAFTSVSEFYEDEKPVVVPNLTVATNTIKTTRLPKPAIRVPRNRADKGTRLPRFN